jgi:hypothetical protein
MSDFDLFDEYEPEQPATLEEERPPRQGRSGGGCRDVFYNLVSIFFLLATVVVCGLTVLLIQNPTLPFNPFPPATLAPTPTLFDLDVMAQSLSTIVPPAATSTEIPASPTPLRRVTSTPAATATGGAALAMTGLPSEFPFMLQDDAVTYTQHPEGCTGSWIIGQLFDMNGNPFPGTIYISVRGENFEQLVFSGTAPQWGESAYEVELNSTPVEAEFELRLLAATGIPLSEPIIVRTLSSCEGNVAVANFIQVRDLTTP